MTRTAARAWPAALLVIAGALLPPALVLWSPPLLGMTRGQGYQVFELLGPCGFLVLLLLGLPRLRRAAPGSPERRAVLLPLLLGLFGLLQVTEHARVNWDYECYERAAQALEQGRNPYATDRPYQYPPLTAQLFRAAHRGVHAVVSAARPAAPAELSWWFVFYLYQVGQLLMLMGCYTLSVRLAVGLGMAAERARWSVVLLLALGSPFLRTLHFNQINLWVLNACLLGLLAAGRRPLAAGPALALGSHAKLIPLVLLGPLLVGRRWAAVLATLAGAVVVLLLQTGGLRDLTLWRQCLEYFREFPVPMQFRNSSWYAVGANTLALLQGTQDVARTPVQVVGWIGRAACGLWIGVRILQRWRAGQPAEQRLLRDGADALALFVLVSPSVWEHHFVFVLPLFLAAAAVVERAGALLCAALLVFLVPTFDLYLLSYHRLAGTLYLLWLTPPSGSSAPQ